MFAWGCNTKDSDKDSKTDMDKVQGIDTEIDTTGEVVPTAAPLPEREAYVVSDYITLGEYKGIEVTVDEIVVADADVEATIASDLEQNTTQKEITDRPVQQGDTANIDFEGMKDGVAFEGGGGQDFDLVIGSGSFIPGFEEGIIGANVGDELALDITFPEEYQNNPDLAGQAVVFNVKVNAIKEDVLPELTEEFAKDVMGHDSIEAYRVAVREELDKQAVETMKTTKINNVFAAILENSEIKSHPETLLNYYSAEMTSYYEQYASMFGMELQAMLEMSGMTLEQHEAEVQAYAESMAAQELVIKAIIEAEKMEITEEEYNAGTEKLMADYGYATKEELLAVGTEEQLTETILWQKVLETVTDLAVEVKAE